MFVLRNLEIRKKKIQTDGPDQFLISYEKAIFFFNFQKSWNKHCSVTWAELPHDRFCAFNVTRIYLQIFTNMNMVTPASVRLNLLNNAINAVVILRQNNVMS